MKNHIKYDAENKMQKRHSILFFKKYYSLFPKDMWKLNIFL